MKGLRYLVNVATLALDRENCIGCGLCIQVCPHQVFALIERKARESMAKIGTVKPYKIEGPVALEVEYTTRSTLSPQSTYAPGIERIGPRTLRYSGKNFMEAWTRYAGR